MTWHSQTGTQMCRIYSRKAADITDSNDWPNQHNWLREPLEKFYRVFGDRVKELNPADWLPADEETGE